MAGWVTEEDLAAHCAAHGLRFTSNQLRDWRQGGLMPRSKQIGLGRGRGTRAVYPPGSCEQLEALLRARAIRVSHEWLLWRVWWQGFPVDEERLLKQLHDFVDGYAEYHHEVVRNENPDNTEDGWIELESKIPRRSTDPGFRKMRKNHGHDGVLRWIVGIAKTLAGVSPDDPGLFNLDPDFDHDVPNQLKSQRELASAFQPKRVQRLVRAASYEDLCDARDEMKTILEFAAKAPEATRVLIGERTARGLIELAAADELGLLRFFLPIWMSLRDHKRAKNILFHLKRLMPD